MKTPEAYRKYLTKRIISKKMLADSLHSVSTRAEHHGAMKLELAVTNRQYAKDPGRKARESEHDYLRMRYTLLSVLEPSKVHRQGSDYFYVYEAGKRLYHTPIGRTEAEESALPIEEYAVNFYDVESQDSSSFDRLISVPFIRKVCELIDSSDFDIR